MIEMRAVDIVQPDVCYMGGIGAHAAGGAHGGTTPGLPCTPHSANLSLVTLFTMHLLRRDPQCRQVSRVLDRRGRTTIPGRRACSSSRPTPCATGRSTVPSEPGWGVEIDPDWLARAELPDERVAADGDERDAAGAGRARRRPAARWPACPTGISSTGDGAAGRVGRADGRAWTPAPARRSPNSPRAMPTMSTPPCAPRATALAGPWKRATPAQRGRVLMRCAELIREHAERLAVVETLDSGKRLSEALGDVERRGARASSITPVPATSTRATRFRSAPTTWPTRSTSRSAWRRRSCRGTIPISTTARGLAPALAAGCTRGGQAGRADAAHRVDAG